MGNSNSPLETLAAFAIVFAAGVLSTVALQAYGYWAKRLASKGGT